MQAEFPPVPVPPRGKWWSDEPEMENDAHLTQMLAIIATLRRLYRGRTDRYVAGNLTVYYSPTQRKSKDFRGPDVFVVKGVDPHPRYSWVVWEEGGRYPDVIIELLSDSTAAIDRGEKKKIYEQIFRLPEYFLFDPGTYEFEGYHLVDGSYQAIQPDERGWLQSRQLELALGVKDGQLRFFLPDGTLVPTPDEAAADATARAESAEARAECAETRAESAETRAESAETRAERAEAELARLRAERGDR